MIIVQNANFQMRFSSLWGLCAVYRSVFGVSKKPMNMFATVIFQPFLLAKAFKHAAMEYVIDQTCFSV